MKAFREVLASFAVGALMLAASANRASAQDDSFDAETISNIEAAWRECSGGYRNSRDMQTLRDAEWHLPAIAFLGRPSSELSDEQANHLYVVAKGLLEPALGRDLADRNSFTCPPAPELAVAILRYLAGSSPFDRRGPNNINIWLGYSYLGGVGVAADNELARDNFLIGVILSYPLFANSTPWADSIDDDLFGNIQRAGLGDFLLYRAEGPRGSGARTILAERELALGNLREARRWLLSPHYRSLSTLAQWEDEGRLPVEFNETELPYWAAAWSPRIHANGRIGRKIIAITEASEGAPLPTALARLESTVVSELLDLEIAEPRAAYAPIPMRALVSPNGQVLLVEPCRPENPDPSSRYTWLNSVHLEATRLYAGADLGTLPPAIRNSAPAYGWVILPAIEFRHGSTGYSAHLHDLPANACEVSNAQALQYPTTRPSP